MKRTSSLPSREELLTFIRERTGKVGTREIARAFGAKNADRATLKRMLRELADDGHIERRRKRLHRSGALPSVVLADIVGRDSDGELLARPTEWDEDAHGAAPVIHIAMARRAGPAVAGVGDRALLRVEHGHEEVRARIIKLIDRAKHRVLGIFRGLPDGGGRLVPIDKKQLGRELAIPRDQAGGAQDGDLVAVEVARSGRLGLPVGAVMERLGSLKSEKAVSLIAIHAHGIPHTFGRSHLADAGHFARAGPALRGDANNRSRAMRVFIPLGRARQELAVAVAAGDVGKNDRRQRTGAMQPLSAPFDVTAFGQVAQHALELGAVGVFGAERAGDLAGADIAGALADESQKLVTRGEGVSCHAASWPLLANISGRRVIRQLVWTYVRSCRPEPAWRWVPPAVWMKP